MGLILGSPLKDSYGLGPTGDTVIGGLGDDYFEAGAGADMLAYAPGHGRDWINGFNPGIDKLQFSSRYPCDVPGLPVRHA